jgi:hypothetical protein
VTTDSWAVARAAVSENKQARKARYRCLTRVCGWSGSRAARELKVCLDTARNYEREILAETGVGLLAARQSVYRRLRDSGIGQHVAAHRMQISGRTSRRWEQALAAVGAAE